MSNELYYNFRKSLEQKYNAVCFDIDGTLTVKNSKRIDNRAINMIVELLKKKDTSSFYYWSLVKLDLMI